MLKEINKAVEIFHRIAFGTKNNSQKLPEKKLAAFVSALTDLLKARYEKNWYPENPDRGSGYRCIRVNVQSIDPTILESLKRAKINLSKDLIITEVTIWVDPGAVSIRIGEDGSIGSEVVDEAVYNIGRHTKVMEVKQSGVESDEGFSSRSSSPESSISDSSRSVSPSTSTSPSPVMEFNPYCPPIHISYPSLYQPTTQHLASQQPQRNPSSTASHFQTHGVRSQCRPAVTFAPTMLSTSNRDHFSQPSYISGSPAVHTAAYSRPQPLFSNHENISTSGSSHAGIGKMAFNPYHAIPMMYGGNLQQANFYDIPAVA